MLKTRKKFKSLNLNRKNGERLFLSLKKIFFLSSPMNSEHSILYVISLTKRSFMNILEIGTYDATNHFYYLNYFIIQKLIRMILNIQIKLL